MILQTARLTESAIALHLQCYCSSGARRFLTAIEARMPFKICVAKAIFDTLC